MIQIKKISQEKRGEKLNIKKRQIYISNFSNVDFVSCLLFSFFLSRPSKQL